MKRALFLLALPLLACSPDEADDEPDLTAVFAAAPPGTESDCATTPDGEQFTHPGDNGAPTIRFPALPDWAPAELEGDIPQFVVTDDWSVFAVDVSTERAKDTSAGAQLDRAKSAIEHLPGWQRTEYRTGTVCGHPAIMTAGTTDLVMHTHIVVTAFLIVGDEVLHTVTVRGQMPDPVDDTFVRDYPIMLNGLRIHD